MIYDKKTGTITNKKVAHKDLPEELFSNTLDKFDALEVRICNEYGIACKDIEYQEKYFQIETNRSMFYLIDSLAQFDNNCEIAYSWRARQREYNYYLEMDIHAVNKDLIDDFIISVDQWIYSNGYLISNDAFSMPEPIEVKNDPENCIEISLDDLEVIDKYNCLKGLSKKHINWDFEYPEYRGADFTTVVAYISPALAITSLVLNYFGFSNPEQRRIKKEKQYIHQSLKRLQDKFPKTLFKSPSPSDEPITSKKYYRVYYFQGTEEDNNESKTYRVKLIRGRGLFKHIRYICEIVDSRSQYMEE